MGKLFTITIAVLAVALGYILSRAGETARFFGDETNPGIFDVFRTKAQSKMSNSASSYQDKVNAFIDGKATGQDSSMVDDYYNIVTDFYEYGWGQSFHFAHVKDGESFNESLARHERELADKVGIKATDKVIDVGCGVGGPARNIHASHGADITGVTLNDYQISRAKHHTKIAGMEDKVRFIQMDFTKLDFADESFDRAYSIEATCHATDLYDVYREVYRVLKPGGVFGSYEWLTTKNTDKSNPIHKELLNDIEFGSGLPPMHSFEDVMVAATKAGFELVYEFDYALDQNISKTWYKKVEMSGISTTITHYFTQFMEAIGLAAKGSLDAHTALCRALRGLQLGGQTHTFTPMHMVIFKKPVV